MDPAPNMVPTDSTAKLRGRFARADDWLGLRLDGIIDEHNRLNDIVAHVSTIGWNGLLVVDMGGIVRLNSVGVRDWVLALRALRPHFQRIQIIDCTPPVMNEVNFVRNFAEGATITTFQAPLFCTRCSREGAATVNVLDLKLVAGTPTLPSFACDRSDCENALDDDESSYLAFLDSQAPIPDPANVRRISDEVRAAFAAGKGTAITTRSGIPTAPTALPHSSGFARVPSPPSTAAPTPQTPFDTAPTAPPSAPRQADIVFYIAVGAMVVVLGVLVYLIATLE